MWSTTSSGGNTKNEQITEDWIPQSENFTFQATDTYPYIVEITDGYGEITQEKIIPTVRENSLNDDDDNSNGDE